jgi:anti-sigma B factor antagonist
VSTAEPREGLLVHNRVDDGVTVVTVTGDVDVATCAALRDSLLQVIAGENFRGLVVNLAGVSFIDSTGIGVLVGAWRRTKATDGDLALASPSRQAQSVLDATGLTKVLSIYRREEEAVQALAQPDIPTDTGVSRSPRS